MIKPSEDEKIAKAEEREDYRKKKEEEEKKLKNSYFWLLYDQLMLMMATWSLRSRNQFQKARTIKNAEMAWFKLRLEENKPEVLEVLADKFKRYQAKKSTDLAETQSHSIIERIDTEWLLKDFKKKLEEQIDLAVWDKVKYILSLMENDIVTTKTLLIQASMAGIIWYYNTITERVKNGEKINTIEFKQLYDILKIELGEATTIKETRQTSASVKIVIGVSDEEKKKILEQDNRQDISINLDDVTEIFKKKVQANLPIIDTQNGWKNSGGNIIENNSAPQTEGVPNTPTW